MPLAGILPRVKKIRHLSHKVSINLPSAGLALSLMGNGSFFFSSPGLVQGSNGPAVQGDWHREWKTAVWEETQSYQSECVQFTAEGSPVSTHFILWHWTITPDLNWLVLLKCIITCLKPCDYLHDIVSLLIPSLPPFSPFSTRPPSLLLF